MRAGGVFNSPYASTFVFTNDFAALKPDTPHGRSERDGLLIAESEPGICRVVCFSPRHNLTIADMEPADLRTVVDTWIEEYQRAGRARIHQLCSDFREPRRYDGGQQSASPRPDLGKPLTA